MTALTYGSVCSGIEAASVAWEPLGWKAAWFSEIEAFPSAVLAHRWPDVPNLGDMLALPSRVDAGEIVAPDVLVGGTPCQAFSVAGNRESLSDARGGLTLAYVELADAIDRQRARNEQDSCIVVWENVPGVLSTKDNAFGCFLAGLAGEDVPLLPPGKRWTNAGLVLGPKRAVAWRILDAQYFGLAQRRRRVFVVASARDGFDPSAVLLEFDGLRRDSAPSREARQEAAGDVVPGAASTGWPADVASTLNAAFGSKLGLEDQHINGGAPLFVPSAIPILEPGARTGASTTDPRAGMGVGADGDPMYTLQAGKQHGVACFDPNQITSKTNRSVPKPELCHTLPATPNSPVAFAVSTGGDIAHTLNTANNGKGCSEDGTGRGVPTIAFSSKDYGADAAEDMAPTLRAGGHADSHANAGVPPAVTVALRGREGGATAEVGGEVATALRASTGGGDKPHVLATMEVAGTMKACAGASGGWSNSADHAAAGYMQVDHNMAVRRLTPTECARLQGFPDDHAQVPYRGKPASDGPMYKAYGNSMAVPVMRWIGRRIVRHLNGEI